MANPVTELVVFDFDGTLAHRPGNWSQALLDVLDANLPGHGATTDTIRSLLRDGFPWHRPAVAHLHLSDPEAWWAHVGALLHAALDGVGVHPDDQAALVDAARRHYCDAAHFLLFDDTLPSLRRLAQEGIDVAILSNHVPELASIVASLGLSELVGTIATSAVIGYEKPNPEAFRCVLGATDPSRCWMVGDNPIADVAGAEAVGMSALLVRQAEVDHRTVGDAVDMILASS